MSTIENDRRAAPELLRTPYEIGKYDENNPLRKAVVDLGTTPHFHDEAYEQVKTIAAKQNIEISLLFPEASARYTDSNGSIIGVIKQLIPNLEFKVSEGSVELGFLTSSGVDGLIFCPREVQLVPTKDESVQVEQIDRAGGLYERIYDAGANN